MPSLRFKASYKELSQIAPRQSKHGATEHVRREKWIRHATKVKNIRITEQVSGGLVEFPFGLFIDGQRIKTVCMTEKEAYRRNFEIGDASMVWRRCGY